MVLIADVKLESVIKDGLNNVNLLEFLMRRNRLIRSNRKKSLSLLDRFLDIKTLLAFSVLMVLFFQQQTNHIVQAEHLEPAPAINQPNTFTKQHLNPLGSSLIHNDIITSEDSDTSVQSIKPEYNIETLLPVYHWQSVTIKKGDSLSSIFQHVGLSAYDLQSILKLNKDSINPLLNLKPEQTIHIAIRQLDSGKNLLEGLQLSIDNINTFYLERIEAGYHAEIITQTIDVKQRLVRNNISSSLFSAGSEAGLTDKTIMELAYIFGWDIDFAHDLRGGDQFKLIYEQHYLDGRYIGDGDILAAEFVNQGKTYRAVRFTDEEGKSDYYSPQGESMKKAFTRTPVPLSRISSRFNPNRRHPILKTRRPHRGVDYAAKTGTPIIATGDGKVHFIGNKGGYGRTVILSHSGRYTTLYAHMSRYRRGLRKGKKVKQGQVIGYIGSSGLATGPHLHYEFRVNGIHRNPLTVALPKATPLPKKYHQSFQETALPLLAQFTSPSPTQLAQR